jgi:hypothetical protein
MLRKSLIFIPVLLLQLQWANAQILGCTDFHATNYNALATQNDGSCLYPSASLSPITSRQLDGSLTETSGLIEWNHDFWSHNDNSDTAIYRIDTATGAIAEKVPLAQVINHDWEELSQDSNYLYLGDFGNNASGNRTNLNILRVSKSSITNDNPAIDTISFSYANQLDFSDQGSNNTNFDCEAFIVTSDSIYLFTKHWVDLATTVYSLPKTSGNHLAQRVDSFYVNGLVTGATFLESKRLVILSGYSKQMAPFIYLLYDFQPRQFFSGNKRKVDLSLPFHQIEGVSTSDGLHLHCSNEYLMFSTLEIFQQFHTFDLEALLGSYLNTGIATAEATPGSALQLYPNPSSEWLTLDLPKTGTSRTYQIFNLLGTMVMRGVVDESNLVIEIQHLPQGSYLLRMEEDPYIVAKFIKL